MDLYVGIGGSTVNVRISLAAHVFAIGLIAVLMLTGTAMGEISRTGLVAEWHFDGDAKDSSGNGIDGTIQGAPIFTDGKLGKALAFSGSGDNVYFGNDGGKLNFGLSDFSIEFWMNYQGTTVHPNFTYIMGKTAGGANSPGFFAAASTWFASGKDYVLDIDTTTSQTWNSGSAGSGGTIGGGPYYPNTWYHLVFVRSGNTWTIYTNGDYSNLATNNDIGLTVNNPVSFNIGASIAPNWNNFKGLIEEVRIYNRALSANEVKANYEAGRIIITSSLSGAEVLVDGNSKGIASPTLSVYGVSPGTHTVKCKLSGYSDYDTNVVLTATGVASVPCSPILITPTPTPTPTPIIAPSPSPSPTPTPMVTVTSTPTSGLTPTPTTSPSPITGSISISSIPTGASIYIDENYQGTTPMTLSIVEGSHTATLKLAGYKDWSQTINVVAGQKSSISPELAPAQPEPTTPVPTATPWPDSSNLYLYGIVIIAIILIAIAALKRRRSYRDTKPVETETIKRPEPPVRPEPEPVRETKQPPIPEDEQKLHKCPNCGAEVHAGDRFCEECGEPLGS